MTPDQMTPDSAFQHTYGASGVFKNVGQGHLQVHGPHWGTGATGIQGLNETMGTQSFLGPPKFFRRASTPALQSIVVLLSGINFPILQSQH